jgi:murein DD-endopeptidase MepM/ murein hydrolase activator NlpD
MKFRTVKILIVLAAILSVHIVVGAVFYYKYSVTSKYCHQLEQDNIRLKEDNRQVYELNEVVQELMKFHEQFKAALEVNRGFETSLGKPENNLEGYRQKAKLISNTILDTLEYSEQMSHTTGKIDYFITREQNENDNFISTIPTYLPVEGFLTTDFRKDDWFLPDHLGIDIATNRGTTVRAAADGVVLFTKWTEDLGNLIIISHLNGYLTYYGHNQVLLVRERSFVKKGQAIAILGSSGRSTAPHLHFEIWKNGVPVDPKDYLLTFQFKNISQ